MTGTWRCGFFLELPLLMLRREPWISFSEMPSRLRRGETPPGKPRLRCEAFERVVPVLAGVVEGFALLFKKSTATCCRDSASFPLGASTTALAASRLTAPSSSACG